MMRDFKLDNLKRSIRDSPSFREAGRLISANGMLTASLQATIGELCSIYSGPGDPILAEVVGFANGCSQLMTLQPAGPLAAGAVVVALGRRPKVPVGGQLTGRVMNGLCQPIDGLGPIDADKWIGLQTGTPAAMTRMPIRSQMFTGQKAIDGLLSIGIGQRVGVFAGSGVGKSTLLGEIAKNANSDINVVVLVGERGREVRPFISESLGPEGLRRSIVIVSTAQEPPLVRIRSAQAAITIADWFRSQGKNVLFMVDSLTRLAWSQRELGLALGEPPSARGFPPSSVQLLANLIEQLGSSDKAAITGVLTVLVDGDDTEEPIADAARSILDGHFVLSRKLAEKGHFPAIDINASVSRVANQVTLPEQQQAAMVLRRALAEYLEVQDMIRIGAYQSGSSPAIDNLIRVKPLIDRFLQQQTDSAVPEKNIKAELLALAQLIESQRGQPMVTTPHQGVGA